MNLALLFAAAAPLLAAGATSTTFPIPKDPRVSSPPFDPAVNPTVKDNDPMSSDTSDPTGWVLFGAKVKQYTVEVKDMDLQGAQQAWYRACKNIVVSNSARPGAVGHQYMRKSFGAKNTDGSTPFMTTTGCWSEYYFEGKRDVRDHGVETAKALDFFLAQTIINHPRPNTAPENVFEQSSGGSGPADGVNMITSGTNPAVDTGKSRTVGGTGSEGKGRGGINVGGAGGGKDSGTGSDTGVGHRQRRRRT